MQSHPQPCKENNGANILWDIVPWQLEKCSKDGANKPDIRVITRQEEQRMVSSGRYDTYSSDIIVERTKLVLTEQV